jgi:hypothetical protein
MSELERWLQRATRQLSRQSIAKVRGEINEHYEEARGLAITQGASPDEAARRALAALGDANEVNCQYRRVMLTSAEASMLNSGSREAKAFCSRAWLKWPLLGTSVLTLITASVALLTGESETARVAFAVTLAPGLLLAAITLPINTAMRGRAFRAAKWAVMLTAMALLMGPMEVKHFWLYTTCLWPILWIEITRASIRRKLPLSQWPRQLYY